MRVVIVGSGGVAEGLLRNINPKVLIQLHGRNKPRVKELSSSIGINYSDELQAADLYILAVSDDKVPSVAATYPFADGAIVVHTAGSVPMSALQGAVDRNPTISIGVLYPMQSFTRGRDIKLQNVPLFIEGDTLETLTIVEQFAQSLSQRVFEVSSEQRRKLHLAAVFACNFTNAMFTASSDIMGHAGVSFDLYEPLINETIAKAIESNNPRASQTGPAKRGDLSTMASHIDELHSVGDRTLIDLYKNISKYIWETSKKI